MLLSDLMVPTYYNYYRHTLPIRLLHWLNVVAVTLLLMSGLQIFNAHPSLQWGKSSYNGRPPLVEIKADESANGLHGVTTLLGHDFITTGLLGVSNDSDGRLTARAFPAWATIPGPRWLAMARRWHLFFAWIFVINGITYLLYSIGSRHLMRDLFPVKQDWHSIGRSIIEHLHFRHSQGEAATRYNVLQKFAYLSVIFGLLPLIIVTGMAMSPWLDALRPGWVDLLGGRQAARTIHFCCAWALVAFVLIHVFEVIITGLWNNLRSMITGQYRIQVQENRHDNN